MKKKIMKWRRHHFSSSNDAWGFYSFRFYAMRTFPNSIIPSKNSRNLGWKKKRKRRNEQKINGIEHRRWTCVAIGWWPLCLIGSCFAYVEFLLFFHFVPFCHMFCFVFGFMLFHRSFLFHSFVCCFRFRYIWTIKKKTFYKNSFVFNAIHIIPFNPGSDLCACFAVFACLFVLFLWFWQFGWK